jgi:nucleoside-diphosphate-sugar epimerase
MNILVTGGTGFIGSHVVEKLLKKRHTVILIKRKTSNTWRIDSFIKRTITYNDTATLDYRKIMKKHSIDLIIHLAGQYIKQHSSYRDIRSMIKSNIDFPSKILDAAVAEGIKYFINTGTFFEYDLKGIIGEKSPVLPYDYYAATKLAFEDILMYYSRIHKLNTLTLKLFSPYGEMDNKKVIPLIIRNAIEGKNVALTKGDQSLCFTYVGDTADAYINAVEYLAKSKKSLYEAINIGVRRGISIKKIVKIIESESGKKEIASFGLLKQDHDETVNIMCDNTKARRILHWSPKTSIEEGIRRTYKFYLTYDRRSNNKTT